MGKEAKQKNKWAVCVATFIFMALSFLGGIGFFLELLNKVVSGHGLDYYTTFWGIQFNYVGALVGFIFGAILMLISPVIYWYSTKEERSFKKKYGIHDK